MGVDDKGEVLSWGQSFRLGRVKRFHWISGEFIWIAHAQRWFMILHCARLMGIVFDSFPS